MDENVDSEQDDNLDRMVNKELAKFEHSSLSCFYAIKCFNLIKYQKGCWLTLSTQYHSKIQKPSFNYFGVITFRMRSNPRSHIESQ